MGTVDSKVFQRSVDYSDEYASGYPVVLHGLQGAARSNRAAPTIYPKNVRNCIRVPPNRWSFCVVNDPNSLNPAPCIVPDLGSSSSCLPNGHFSKWRQAFTVVKRRNNRWETMDKSNLDLLVLVRHSRSITGPGASRPGRSDGTTRSWGFCTEGFRHREFRRSWFP